MDEQASITSMNEQDRQYSEIIVEGDPGRAIRGRDPSDFDDISQGFDELGRSRFPVDADRARDQLALSPRAIASRISSARKI